MGTDELEETPTPASDREPIADPAPTEKESDDDDAGDGAWDDDKEDEDDD